MPFEVITDMNSSTFVPEDVTPPTKILENQGGQPFYTHNLSNHRVLFSGAVSLVKMLLPGAGGESSITGEGKGQTQDQDYVYKNAEARQDRRLQLAVATEGWRLKTLHTAMGFINNLVYRVADCLGGLSRDEEGGIVINREQLATLVKAPCPPLVMALCSTVDYLKGFWPQASHNVNTIRGVIDQLRELGLVDYYSEQAKGKRSRIYTYIDIPGLLLLAEALERRIGYDGLPDHKAAILQKIYNALFSGWGYNREGEPDTQEPSDYAESVAVRRERSWQFWQGFEAAKRAALATYHHFLSIFGPDDPLTLGALGEGRSRYGASFGTG